MKRLIYVWFACVVPVAAAASAAPMYQLTTLATFNFTNEALPEAGLIADANGNLFGTTNTGGANGFGTVFSLAAGTHALSTVVSFNGTLTLSGANTYTGATAASGPPKTENQQIKRCNGELMEEPQGAVAVNATHRNRRCGQLQASRQARICSGRADRRAQSKSGFVAGRPFRRQAAGRLSRARRASRGESAGAASTR